MGRLLTNLTRQTDLKIFLTGASGARCRTKTCRKTNDSDMCEINRKNVLSTSLKKLFIMPLLQSYSHVECSTKCVMIGVREFIFYARAHFSRDTVQEDTEEMLLHAVSGTSTNLNQGWAT